MTSNMLFPLVGLRHSPYRAGVEPRRPDVHPTSRLRDDTRPRWPGDALGTLVIVNRTVWWWLAGAVALAGCVPAPRSQGGEIEGSPSTADTAGTVADRPADGSPPTLIDRQRTWLVEVQIDLRGALAVVDTLQAWWRTPELASMERALHDAEYDVRSFAARYRAPRLATAWSPVDRPETPWARRYDHLVGRGLRDVWSAHRQADWAVRGVVDVVTRGDLGHPEIALLVSSLTERLTTRVPTPT